MSLNLSQHDPAIRARLKDMRRQALSKRNSEYAVLGNGAGQISAGAGKVWVRFPRGTNDDGTMRYSPPTIANAGVGIYYRTNNAGVRVGFNAYGELTVLHADERHEAQAGRDVGLLNPGTPQKAWSYIRNIATFKNLAPGGATTVSNKGLVYFDNFGDLSWYAGTPLLADKLDLASFIPTAGNHRIVVVMFDAYNAEIYAVGSTTQAQTSALGLTDYQEAIAQARADSIPIQAYELADAQTTIDETHKREDLRQVFNMPQAWGFPSTVSKDTRIHTGQNVTVDGNVEVTTGNLIVEGTLAVHSHPPNITKTNIRVLEKLTANVFELDTPVWNDIFIGLSGAKVPAANAPTWATFVTPIKQYTFDVNDYFDLAAAEILHGYREGTDFDLHVHFATNGVDGTDRGVKWQIDYTCANIGGAFPAVTTISAESTILANTPDRTHTYLDIGTVSGTGINIGALIAIRITRIAAVGTAPSSDPFGLMVGIHYEVNTLGSTTEAAK